MRQASVRSPPCSPGTAYRRVDSRTVVASGSGRRSPATPRPGADPLGGSAEGGKQAGGFVVRGRSHPPSPSCRRSRRVGRVSAGAAAAATGRPGRQSQRSSINATAARAGIERNRACQASPGRCHARHYWRRSAYRAARRSSLPIGHAIVAAGHSKQGRHRNGRCHRVQVVAKARGSRQEDRVAAEAPRVRERCGRRLDPTVAAKRQAAAGASALRRERHRHRIEAPAEYRPNIGVRAAG